MSSYYSKIISKGLWINPTFLLLDHRQLNFLKQRAHILIY